jgi:hypothetical protein
MIRERLQPTAWIAGMQRWNGDDRNDDVFDM